MDYRNKVMKARNSGTTPGDLVWIRRDHNENTLQGEFSEEKFLVEQRDGNRVSLRRISDNKGGFLRHLEDCLRVPVNETGKLRNSIWETIAAENGANDKPLFHELYEAIDGGVDDIPMQLLPDQETARLLEVERDVENIIDSEISIKLSNMRPVRAAKARAIERLEPKVKNCSLFIRILR